jgi:biopolymer transport protein ExbD
MRARVRRRRREGAALEITAFLNLIVVLVPFLLSTAVFSRLSVLQLNLPAQSSGFDNLSSENLQLEVVIRRDGLEVGSKMGGLLMRIDNTDKGYNFGMLSDFLQRVKARYPDNTEVTILAEPETSYDLVVQTMDAARVARTSSGSAVELFPEISIGDAPLPVRAETPKKSEKAS